MNRKLLGLALFAVLVLGTLLGGCASTASAPADQAERAERFVAIAQNTALAFRDAQVHLRDRAVAEGDTRTAEKARSAVTRVNQVLPYFDLAQAGLRSARGDPAAQARVLAELVTHFNNDPEIAVLVALIPPLINELKDAGTGQPPAHT